MRSISTLLFAVALATALSSPVHAQANDDVLAENATARLTRADYDAELLRIPPDQRDAFASDARRLTTFLNNMLIGKTLAAQARKEGIDRDPVVQRQIELETVRLLSALEVQRIEADAARDFDAHNAQYLAKAREIYIVDRPKFRRPQQFALSQIVIDASGGNDAALALAQSARAKLASGADFASVAKELSDDRATRADGGRLPWLGSDAIDGEVVRALANLKKGDVTEPVRGRRGYYIVRLEDSRPAEQQSFDEVKDAIMADLRTRHIDEAREARLSAIRNDPAMKVNQAAVDALLTKPNPELLKPARPRPADVSPK